MLACVGRRLGVALRPRHLLAGTPVYPGVRIAAVPCVGSRRACQSTVHSVPTLTEIRGFTSPGELDGARLTLLHALDTPDLSVTRTVDLQHLLATTYIRLGSVLEAEDVLEEAMQLAGATSCEDAQHREFTFMLGVCYQKSGRLDKAIDVFEEVQ